MIENKKINSKIQKQISLIMDQFNKNEMKEFLENFVNAYAAIGDSKFYGGKHCGSDAEHEGARYIYDVLNKMGIDAEMLPFKTTRFQFNDSSLTAADKSRMIKPYACLSVPTGKDGITTQIVDVKKGDKFFYEQVDIRNKIALIETKEEFEDGTIAGVYQMYEAEKHGAAAIVLYTNDYILDNETIRATYSMLKINIPVVTVAAADAEYINHILMERPETDFTLTVDTEYEIEGGTSYEVVGEIKGESDERIVFSAHLDHFFRCIQDNITAVATLLGIAKAVKDAGIKPARTINFIFSGSHEIGRIDSGAPDLLGAWELLENLKPEWDGKIVADINFEYTGMQLNALRSLASYEMGKTYEDFLRYMPDKMPGLGEVIPNVNMDDYYLMTWADSCAFIMKGIPVLMNDAVYEQIYETTSPYLGRDHSNKDDMSIYSVEAHVSATCWYGCLGLYLAEKAFIEPDYSPRSKVMALTEEEKEILAKVQIDYSEYEKQLELFSEYGKIATKWLRKLSENEQSKNREKVESVNAKLLQIQKILADGTDGLTTTVPSMISVPHKVYIEKGSMLLSALDMIEKEGYEAAYDKILRAIDIIGMEERFDGHISKEIKNCVLGRNATWNKGKCFNAYTKNDVAENNVQNTYDINNQIIKKVLEDETKCLNRINDLLIDVIMETADFADTEQMMGWIKEFTKLPHRRTGTEEGRLSSEIVVKNFKELGLENVEVELSKSNCVEQKKCTLKVNGQEVECFPSNGTNRWEETGDFLTETGEVEIVYLGKGESADFENVDVRGKLVICDIHFLTSHPMELLSWMEDAEIYDPKRKAEKPLKKYDIYTPNNWPYNYLTAMEKGAVGFIGILHDFMDCKYYHEDYIDIIEMDNWMKIPAVWVSKEDGEKLKTANKGQLTLHTVYEKKDARVVKGELKGKSDEVVVVQSHHDAVSMGAVQDASGMSVVFAIADFFAKIPLEMRKKTLMFVSTDTHYTDYNGHVSFLENRKEDGTNIILDFAVEHIAQEMDLDENNNIVLTGEPETRMFYISDSNGLYNLAKEAVAKYDLEKTVLFPVRGVSSGAYTHDDVCSDAYDFNAAGIPVLSILSAPMYLFHATEDTLDKIHQPSLVKVLKAYVYMILHSFKLF